MGTTDGPGPGSVCKEGVRLDDFCTGLRIGNASSPTVSAIKAYASSLTSSTSLRLLVLVLLGLFYLVRVRAVSSTTDAIPILR